jgi:L-alanine-DL-glutamate epimerase-like enolase superfamily enzyme
MPINELISQKINQNSSPSGLRITDMRFTDITGIPFHTTLMKIYTNQGITGFGEIRDGASKRYAQILKSVLLGENPCDVDRLFRRIKQFGGSGRQGGGVSGVETALWDLAGKAYAVPVYALLGGKFRDSIRMYADTDITGKHTGKEMGSALKKRMEAGYTFLKMDLGLDILQGLPNTVSAPLGYFETQNEIYMKIEEAKNANDAWALRYWKNRLYDANNVMHPFTGIHITENGLDILENYVADVRSVIGYEVPLAVDHFGHLALEDCIKLCRRIEKFNLAWAEDMIPWQLTEQYKILRRQTAVPICTGEDIYLKEGFKPLLESGSLSVIHPDVLTAGGILETKKISDLAALYGAAMCIHMAESPIGCLAAVHTAAACENFTALEFHSVDIAQWNNIYEGNLPKPLVQNGHIKVPDTPGLGIDSLNDEVLAELIHPEIPGMWEDTAEFDTDPRNDRLWS